MVIDNASDDGTIDLLRDFAERHEQVTVVRNSDNRGFAAACNQGASALATPWVAFVNPDCYVESGALERLVRHGVQRAGAGMLGVDLVDEFGEADPAARRRDPSLRELLDRRGRRDDLYLGRDPQAVLQPVEAISGALMLMPLGLFLQLGGFDEGFRMHVEDLDLCRRTRDAGYEVVVANDITVVHVGGESSRARPFWVEWQKHISLWRYFRKFEAPRHAGPAGPGAVARPLGPLHRRGGARRATPVESGLTARNPLIASRRSLAAARAASAKSSPLPAYRIAREELMSRPVPSAVAPWLTTASTSPPCAPMPGTSKGMSPTISRTSASSLRPGRADHQQAVAVAVPFAGDGLGDALVQRLAAAVQVLEILGARDWRCGRAAPRPCRRGPGRAARNRGPGRD